MASLLERISKHNLCQHYLLIQCQSLSNNTLFNLNSSTPIFLLIYFFKINECLKYKYKNKKKRLFTINKLYYCYLSML